MGSFVFTTLQEWMNEMINRENIKMKCFHLDDQSFYVPAKCGKVHDKRTQKYWGHIVTNKAGRTRLNYALLFDPNGERANFITESTFKLLSPFLQHTYIKTVETEVVNDFIDQIPNLTKFQARRLIKCLVRDSPHLTNYGSEYTKFKDERFLIVAMED